MLTFVYLSEQLNVSHDLYIYTYMVFINVMNHNFYGLY